MNRYILTWECGERPGIVHAITGALLERSGDIRELKQFDDEHSRRIFLRIEFVLDPGGDAEAERLHDDLETLAAQLEATWRLQRKGEQRRVLVMVSRFEHCLNDLLFRSRIGELPIEIAAVVSNHPDHRQLVEWHRIPFFRVPVTAETKPEAERQLLELVERFEVDLVVLARYMQVLSDDLARELTGRAINIHHSFLPSFKGAKPYHQAFERGVKTVGATAHYVNSELDEGPIIAQQVVEVDHSFGPAELAAAGRDAECKALSNAVRWHCEGRVFLNGGRTVVLR
ncbi:formyltetrahydrofolate deformylase [Leucobacter sp. wl10]|uniref:formyltetrahydrofolate deformylase n=1 Tax=Leucobacter sp. wl10 TaxID=2304677 RepID=UPI000E5AEE29|nr:formyltetrahydrofolate deformylase [Leucobacter sp. wl10]RGE24383.1 formyltetrahydrofolate deformylase [Leucobacter sp. wl10]